MESQLVINVVVLWRFFFFFCLTDDICVCACYVLQQDLNLRNCLNFVSRWARNNEKCKFGINQCVILIVQGKVFKIS